MYRVSQWDVLFLLRCVELRGRWLESRFEHCLSVLMLRQQKRLCFELGVGIERTKSILWFLSRSVCWAKRKEGMKTLTLNKPILAQNHHSFYLFLSFHVISLTKNTVRRFANRNIFSQTQLPPFFQTSEHVHKHNLSSYDNCDLVLISPILNPDLTNLAWTPNEAVWRELI